jgi:hypothetical protein
MRDEGCGTRRSTRRSGFQKLSFGIRLDGFMFIADLAKKAIISNYSRLTRERGGGRAGDGTFWEDGRRDESLRFGLHCFWQNWWRCRRWESVGLAFCDVMFVGMGDAE